MSFLDLDALVAPGGTFDAALIEQVDLAPRGQLGPLTVALTADGSRAVVLLSPGVLAFVGGRLGVDTDGLPDTGAGVVILDIETRQVVAEFPSTDIPIMAAIDEGGTGSSSVSLAGPTPMAPSPSTIWHRSRKSSVSMWRRSSRGWR